MRLHRVGRETCEDQEKDSAVFHGLARRNFKNSEFDVSVVLVLAVEV